MNDDRNELFSFEASMISQLIRYDRDPVSQS